MSKSQAQKVEIKKSDKTDEFKTKVLVKSGRPKSFKEAIKMVVTTILNFIS